jgi:hypothetical protein
MKRCEFQGGAGLPEKYRPKAPCLGEFDVSRPNNAEWQRYCAVCAPFAKKWVSAQNANARYKGEPEKYAKITRENRWKRRKASGGPCRHIGSMQPCEYRDKRRKRGQGCEIRYKLRSSAQRYCDPCQLRADADRAQDYRDKYPEKEKARQLTRSKTTRELLNKIKKGEYVPKPVSPGRPKLAPEETRVFEIGQAVEQFIQPAKMALKIISKLPSHSRGDLLTFRDELLALGFKKDEVPLAQFARTAKQLGRRVIAARENMTEASVTRCHQAYVSELERAA